jgi:hypothetical protein
MTLVPISPYVVGDCAICGRTFGFNARVVVTVQALGHVRPICKACLEMANERRAVHHLPLLKIPPGAYEPEPS